jgi:hypothetical protein
MININNKNWNQLLSSDIEELLLLPLPNLGKREEV